MDKEKRKMETDGQAGCKFKIKMKTGLTIYNNWF
jgi:hypothetical protein